MPYLLIKHKVTSYERWYAAFKSDAKAQKSAGLQDIVILKDMVDPSLIVSIYKFNDFEKAKEFTKSPDAGELTEISGILCTPEIFFLEKM